MIGLADKSVAELNALIVGLRARLACDPQHSPVEQIALSDAEWEIEKRRWRKDPSKP
jgi:hypothetical protein